MACYEWLYRTHVEVSMKPEPIRVLLVDDHVVVRDGIKSLLEHDGFAQVVGVASTAKMAQCLVETTSCNLVVLDMGLPDSDGIACTRQMLTVRPDLRVLILSMHADIRLLTEAMEAGIKGYVLKTASYVDLRRAICEVHEGHTYVEPRLAGLLFERARGTPSALSPLDSLSQREREILTMAARGLNNHEIAESLILTVSTVKTHLRGIYRKCQVKDRVQAVLFAIRHGLGD
jgi:DNA-binding NarL/FixJ family response regulator